MANLDKTGGGPVATTVKWRFPSIHPEGRKFVVGAAFIALAVYWMASHFLGLVLLGVTLWVAAFFRDPIRATPRGDKLVIAPADGLITLIAKVPPPLELRGSEGMAEGDYTRVSIFMSVFDVHINRSPVSGRVKRIVYVPGKFLNADLDKASEDNERQYFLVETADGLKIGFTQIAGLVARRILSFVHRDDLVEAGERVGLIRFGSRVDVYLPEGVGTRILLGQRAIAGETIIGEVGAEATPAGKAQ
jgi:phosphatidylserine decarboxylase